MFVSLKENKIRYFFLISMALAAMLCCCLALAACYPKDKFPKKKYLTKNVIVIVVDGARYSETWGFKDRQLIPERAGLFDSTGVMVPAFYNDGVTATVPGHTALCTGNYQQIDNFGKDIPDFPSVFQYWLKKSGAAKEKAWIIASKDKLEVLNNCKDVVWAGKYQPSVDCGISGLGSGVRMDTVTLQHILATLGSKHPNLMLINFREPDASGHAADSLGYIKGIRDTDKYIRTIWNVLQQDPFYAGTTTLFVTNDHGRHLPGLLDGYVSHGDSCVGCRHIELFAVGPDFKSKYTALDKWQQIDVPATIAELMHVEMPTGKGKVMRELFK